MFLSVLDVFSHCSDDAPNHTPWPTLGHCSTSVTLTRKVTRQKSKICYSITMQILCPLNNSFKLTLMLHWPTTDRLESPHLWFCTMQCCWSGITTTLLVSTSSQYLLRAKFFHCCVSYTYPHPGPFTGAGIVLLWPWSSLIMAVSELDPALCLQSDHDVVLILSISTLYMALILVWFGLDLACIWLWY